MTAFLLATLGVLLLALIARDTFEGILLPRTVNRPLSISQLYFRASMRFRALAAGSCGRSRFREGVLGSYGPLSMLGLFAVWSGGFIVAFALGFAALGNALATPEQHPGFWSDLYVSGASFFTVGFGDVVPKSGMARTLAVLEAGTGLGYLAIVIGYLPVLYQAFSRREVGISLMDARAGSPPTGVELILRHARSGVATELAASLADWERWAADLLESHLSFPVLATYRSQHDRQSWLSALCTVLDACTLIRAGLDLPAPIRSQLEWQALSTYAMCRHAVVDLSLVLGADPERDASLRLDAATAETVRAQLAGAGVTMLPGAPDRLMALCAEYEPYVRALGARLILTLPAWLPEPGTPDDWQVSAWDAAHHFAG